MAQSTRLGLTFYGGVSLAVFQAGVAYELIRAVQFSRAVEGGAVELPDGAAMRPLHVDLITGTSSGGMAAMQLALALGGINADAVLARMVETWVSGADFALLIPPSDCDEQGLLTTQPSRALMQAMLDAANQVPEGAERADGALKLEHDLDCYLTLTNVHGLRESVVLREPNTAPRPALARRTFATTRHHEYERISDDDITDFTQHERMITAVLATAGFPIAFQPIIRASQSIDEEIADEGERTTFAYIDGGVVDNEPLSVALDALAERPAADRRLFFIDPSAVWAQPGDGADDGRVADPADHRAEGNGGGPAFGPGYGGQQPKIDALDPLSIYFRVAELARSEGIHQDLERLRGIEDRLDLLRCLRQFAFAHASFRADLLAAYADLRPRRFDPGAWALWTLIGGEETAGERLFGPAVATAWARVAGQERFPLRVRLGEYLDLLALPADHPARLVLAENARWSTHYAIQNELRDLDRRFRHLRYLVWYQHFRLDEPGLLSDDLQRLIVAAFNKLAEQGERLQAERERLIDQVAGAAVRQVAGDGSDQGLGAAASSVGAPVEAPVGAPVAGPAAASAGQATWRADFLDFARAVQVLESLSSIAYSPNLRARRISPFDLYTDCADFSKQRPLAGAALGAFGGFLEKRWRVNDFLVGRLVMRRTLAREGLVPDAALPTYLAWSGTADARLQTGFATDSDEYRLLAESCGLASPLPPYPDDAGKPACLLRPQAMQVGGLPSERLARHAPALATSLRRIARRNRTKLGYRLLGPLLAPAVRVGSLLLGVADWTLRLGRGQPPTTDALVRRARAIVVWAPFVVLLALLVGIAIGRRTAGG